MSAIGDALASLKSVMLMQERIDGLRTDVGRVSGDLRTLTEKVGDLNGRVIRIETMIEIYDKQAQRRIEG